MLFLLRGSVAVLGKQAAANQMVPHLTERFRVEFGHSPSRAEVLSWERSIPLLLGQLADAGLEDVEVLVEYQLPRYSGRADVILLGQHPRGGRRAWWWRTSSGAGSGRPTSSICW